MDGVDEEVVGHDGQRAREVASVRLLRPHIRPNTRIRKEKAVVRAIPHTNTTSHTHTHGRARGASGPRDLALHDGAEGIIAESKRGLVSAHGDGRSAGLVVVDAEHGRVHDAAKALDDRGFRLELGYDGRGSLRLLDGAQEGVLRL